MLLFLESGGEKNPFTAKQTALLSMQTVTFVLGSHFNCPPHSWDDLPADRVYLDYLFVMATKEIESKEQEKALKESKRYNAKSNQNKGRPLRTTSDAAELDDFFDRINSEY